MEVRSSGGGRSVIPHGAIWGALWTMGGPPRIWYQPPRTPYPERPPPPIGLARLSRKSADIYVYSASRDALGISRESKCNICSELQGDALEKRWDLNIWEGRGGPLPGASYAPY